MKKNKSKTGINAELQKFQYSVEEWWDLNGPFRMLHLMNEIRIPYICEIIDNSISKSNIAPNTLLDILDVGCGGGLVSIPLSMSKLNINQIIAIDPNISNINSINDYLKKIKKTNSMNIPNIKAINCFVEDLINKKYIKQHSYEQQKYDIIICSEVIEHVKNQHELINAIWQLLKPRGIFIISTMNKTIKSYLETIVAAEYILKLVPKNTHDWQKFLSPSDIVDMIVKSSSYNEDDGKNHNKNKDTYKIINISGMKYNIIDKKWLLDKRNISNNYIMSIIKT